MSNKNDCDGKKCDDTALPCSFAKQVVFSKDGEISDLKEEIKKSFDDGFIGGIIVALQVIHLFDYPVIAQELIHAHGDFKLIEKACLGSGSKVDTDTLKWLKKNGVR
jgi:hypothetical protein